MNLRSGVPLWPWRDGMLSVYPPLTCHARADVVVIGAGITGALVARALTVAGAEVLVVDKRDVANGSSAATSGLLMHETDTSLTELTTRVGADHARRAWQLGVEAIDALEQMIAELGDACGFARRDSLYVASSRGDARRMREEEVLRQRFGFSADWIERADLRLGYGIEAFGAIRTPRNAQVDCFRLTHRLLQSAVSHGARVFDRTEVALVEAHDAGCTVVTAEGPTIACRRVVWAAGYEGVEETQRRVGQMKSTWIVTTEPLPEAAIWREQLLLWESARPYLYARITDDGRAMVGGEDEPFATRHADARVMEKKAARLVKRFASLMPNREPLKPSFRWGGTFSETKDGLPYIGTVPEHPHAWLAMGYGGNGITFSVIASQLITDAWLGRHNADLSLFSFSR